MGLINDDPINDDPDNGLCRIGDEPLSGQIMAQFTEAYKRHLASMC